MPPANIPGVPKAERGCVILVGAGPGAADLITRRGENWLRQADVVLYDYLANPALLSHVSPRAELICLGRHGKERVWTQEQINQRIVKEALSGKCVVRLKGGDPTIFGCLSQELEPVIEAGIPFEIVPGVTAATAAAAGAGVAITHRDFASAVAFVTGREDNDKLESALDYQALAAFPGTLVFYMGTTTVQRWSEGLMQSGKPPSTPVAIVRRASLQDQSVHRTTLEKVCEFTRSTPPLRPPVVFIVGEVSQGDLWLAGERLKRGRGQSVLVTRPQEQSRGLIEKLQAAGFQTTLWPALRIAEPASWTDVDREFETGNRFDLVAFTSANGVEGFVRRLLQTGRDTRWLAQSRLAAVGPSTAERLEARGLRCEVVPSTFDSQHLAEQILAQPQRPQRVLIAGAEQARPTLAAELRANGIEVEQLTVYRAIEPEQADGWTLNCLEAGLWNWTTVTSPRIAENLVTTFGERLHQTRLVSISPLTSSRIRELGFEVAVEASESSDDGICQALLEAS